MGYIITGLVAMGLILWITYSSTKYSFTDEIKQYNKGIDEILRLYEKIEIELDGVMLEKVVYKELLSRFEHVENQVDKANRVFTLAMKKRSKKLIEDVNDALDELQEGLYEIRFLFSRAINIREEWERELRFQKARAEYVEFKPKPKGYFSDCSTKTQIKKRYRQLVKNYHPDNGGDRLTFEKIQKEYSEAVKERL